MKTVFKAAFNGGVNAVIRLESRNDKLGLLFSFEIFKQTRISERAVNGLVEYFFTFGRLKLVIYLKALISL